MARRGEEETLDEVLDEILEEDDLSDEEEEECSDEETEEASEDESEEDGADDVEPESEEEPVSECETESETPAETVDPEPAAESERKRFDLKGLALFKKGDSAGGSRKPDLKDLKKFGKKILDCPGKAYRRAYDWMWGTEKRPLHPFSIRGKFKRWFLIKYRGYCYLIMTMYDRDADEYSYSKDIIPRKELPRDAVHVTGEKNTYHIDLLLKKRGFSSVSDNGFTAVDAFLYMKCNKIDEAMAIKLDSPKQGMDTQKLLGIIAIGVGAMFAVYYLIMQ